MSQKSGRSVILPKRTVTRSKKKSTLSSCKSGWLRLKPNESGALDRIVIKGRLIGLNEYVAAERTNRYKAAQIKRDTEELITLSLIDANEAGTLHSHIHPCELWITWVEPNHRRDIDNISFATKMIQDAMVRAGVFPDDNSKFICLLHHTVAYDNNNPRVEITIRERKYR